MTFLGKQDQMIRDGLRRKLADAAPEFDPISSVYGVGYRYGD